MPPPADDVTATITSEYRVTGEDVAEQICRSALGAGLQARKHTTESVTAVVVDHLVTERLKVEQIVRALDPHATLTIADDAG